MFKKKPPPANVDEKLDAIIHNLERINRRDSWRTFGGFIKGIIGIVPVAVLLVSMWYFYEYGDEILKKVAETAAQQAAIVTQGGAEALLQNGSNDLMKQLQGLMGQ